MDSTYKIQPIGKVIAENGMFSIQLEKKFIPGLTNIDGFQFLQIVWWGHLHDTSDNRSRLVIEKPYTKGPDQLGVFATRSEIRPNPILITTVMVFDVDKETGKISIPYIDAAPGSFVLDIKPYHRIERIKNCEVPVWCDHWPKWYEEAGDFNWGNEFNF